MQQRYTSEQLEHIREQALIFQCACPAQVCVALDQTRQLHAYQSKCLNQDDTDASVHERIRLATERVHQEYEQCLTDVLEIEGWDMETLTMPEDLQKNLVSLLEKM